MLFKTLSLFTIAVYGLAAPDPSPAPDAAIVAEVFKRQDSSSGSLYQESTIVVGGGTEQVTETRNPVIASTNAAGSVVYVTGTATGAAISNPSEAANGGSLEKGGIGGMVAGIVVGGLAIAL